VPDSVRVRSWVLNLIASRLREFRLRE